MIVNLTGQLGACAILTYRTPAESVRGLVPPGLELRTRGSLAYWQVMACRIDDLHLAGFATSAKTHHLLLYRLHVQAMTRGIDLRRGLFTIRAEADAELMPHLGHALAFLQPRLANIHLDADARTLALTSTSSDCGASTLMVAERTAPHPEGSSFPTASQIGTWLDASEWDLSLDGPDVRYVEAFAEPTTQPMRTAMVEAASWSYLAALGQTNLFLERAEMLVQQGLKVRWRIGRRERLLQPGTSGVIDTLAVYGRRELRRRGRVVLPSRAEPVPA
jgi:hypothetical protein